jgi:hypothetical protein
MDRDQEELSLDEMIKYVGIMYDNKSWEEYGFVLSELYKPKVIDNKSKIKQLKQQSRYSKNPMEIKRLNQEIMKLQREVNKERKVK